MEEEIHYTEIDNRIRKSDLTTLGEQKNLYKYNLFVKGNSSLTRANYFLFFNSLVLYYN